MRDGSKSADWISGVVPNITLREQRGTHIGL